MKKKFILMIFIIFALFGCKNVEEIDFENDDLQESMHNFDKAEYVAYAQGEHFKVKILSVAKVYSCKDSIVYKYSIAIAPYLDEKMEIKSIQLSLKDEEIQKYYEGANSYDYFTLPMVVDSHMIPVKKSKEEMQAYRIERRLDNLNNAIQQEAGYSQQQLDEIVSKFYIEIKYNISKEIIYIEVDPANFLIVEKESDIPNGREDLEKIFETGTCHEINFGIFDDKWPIISEN